MLIILLYYGDLNTVHLAFEGWIKVKVKVKIKIKIKIKVKVEVKSIAASKSGR